MCKDIFLRDLSARFGEAAVLTEGARIAPYAQDWTGRFRGRARAVLRPRTTADAAAMVAACAGDGVTLVPQAGNTGLAAGAVPDDTGRQVILSVERMTAIRALDPLGMTLEVEAGVVLTEARTAAAEHDRMLPLSLAAEGSARIGGLVATNAGGSDVLRYGQMRGLVLGLEAVLPDGQIYSALHHLRKNNSGVDFKQLFIGTEGRFGLITAAVLRLLPRPRHRETALLSVPRLSAALETFDLFQSAAGETLTGFELINGRGFGWAADHAKTPPPLSGAPWYLLVEFSSALPGIGPLAQQLFERAFGRDLLLDGVIAQNETQQRAFWALREGMTEAERRHGRIAKHDLSVPIGRLVDFIGRLEARVQQEGRGISTNVFGHLGDGNLHCNLVIPDGGPVAGLSFDIHELTLAFGGSISAEHGLGHYRWPDWRRLRDPQSAALDEALKRACDPAGLFNPMRGGGAA